MSAVLRATLIVLADRRTSVTVRTARVRYGSIRCIRGLAGSRPLSGKADVKPHKADVLATPLAKLTPPSTQPTLAYGGHQKMRFAAGAVREGVGGSIEDFTLKIWPL